MTNELKTLVVTAEITATSNKQPENKGFKIESPKKSIYLKPATNEERQKLIDFGIQEYGKEEKFFIVKSTDTIKCWNGKTLVGTIISDLESKNYHFPTGLALPVAIIKGEKAGNKFYRLNSVNIGSSQIDDVFQISEETSPF